MVKIRIFYSWGVEGAAPYSGKRSKNSTIHEEIVERICGPHQSDHEKISTVHEKNVEKFSDQIEFVGEGLVPSLPFCEAKWEDVWKKTVFGENPMDFHREGTRPSPTAEENHKKISTVYEKNVEKNER